MTGLAHRYDQSVGSAQSGTNEQPPSTTTSISPAAGGEAFVPYLGGNGGVAGVRSTGGDRVVVLGFPFESIAAVDDRAALMATILDSLGD